MYVFIYAYNFLLSFIRLKLSKKIVLPELNELQIIADRNKISKSKSNSDSKLFISGEVYVDNRPPQHQKLSSEEELISNNVSVGESSQYISRNDTGIYNNDL